MMNILWIEDFDGLPTDTGTLNSMFQDLISFDNWDEDELSLLSRPNDLENFCRENSALHCIYLCRHYYDYLDFKRRNEIVRKIDAVIIDIRLNNGVDFDLPIPNTSNDLKEKEKFHNNAGFYIFNDLVHSGFPSEKMCFMTGEKNSLTDFEAKCHDMYVPKFKGFEKRPEQFKELSQWIKAQKESDYSILRRGVIEGCDYLKRLPEEKLRFNRFIADTEKYISLDGLHDYLDVLQKLLPLTEPRNDETYSLYRLLIGVLAHEWEAAEPKALKASDGQKQQELFAFSWIMKMTRNWSAHGKVFVRLRPEDVAYLFIINMRVMFDLGDKLLPYEKILLRLFKIVLVENEFKEKIGKKPEDRKIPLSENYARMLHASGNTYQAINFHDILNGLQRSGKETDSAFLMKGLYQVFWFLTSSGQVYIPDTDKLKNFTKLNYQFKYFDYGKKEYLFEIGRHIFNSSFTEEKLR